MVKKISALLLAGALAFSLAACGKEDSVTPPGAANPGAPAASTPASSGSGEVPGLTEAFAESPILLTTGGPLLVERFFSVPGMGPLLTDAIGRYDTSVVQALQNFMKKKSAAVMAFVFFAVVVFTFIATAIGKYQYTELRTRLMEKFTSPNSEYWFGTDNLGRD